MIINHNIPAIIANNALSRANTSINKASTRLSTGYRINDAKDDAAGLAISNKMTAQIRGLSMAERNVEDASSLLSTADSGLAEVDEMVQRLREIAVEGAHGIYSTSDREKLQAEVDQLIEEIDSVSDKIKFNTQNLLDGKNSFTFQVGQNTGLTLTVKLDSVSAMCLGYKAAANEDTYLTYTAEYDETSESGERRTEDVTVRSLASLSSDYSDYYATGIIDTYENLEYELESFDAFAADYEELIASGVDPNSSEAIISLNKAKEVYSYMESTADYLSKMINEVENGTHGSTENAADISSQVANADSKLSDFMSTVSERLATLENTSVDTGKEDSQSALEDLKNVLEDELIPAAKDYFESVSDGEGAYSSQGGCSTALLVCDSVLSEITRMRAIVGAAVNRLGYTLTAVQTSNNDMQDARSRVLDADMAQEMSDYSKYNIIIQAGISMLSQANQRPEQLLALIQ